MLLRLGVAGSGLVLASLGGGDVGWRSMLAILLALSITIGCWTRATTLSAAVILPLLAHDLAPVQNLVLHLIGSAALSLIGPGAYSVDSRLYGRRRIVLPAHSNWTD